MVDQLLGGLFGGQDDDDMRRRSRANDFASRYEQGAPYDNIGDDEVVHNYQRVAGQLSPQEYEAAAAKAFGRMSPQERMQLMQMMQQQGNVQFGGNAADPRVLAQAAAQQRQQSGGDLLGSLFGMGGGGLGGMLGGAMGGHQSQGSMLNNPIAKAALGGIAAMAMRRMMGGR